MTDPQQEIREALEACNVLERMWPHNHHHPEETAGAIDHLRHVRTALTRAGEEIEILSRNAGHLLVENRDLRDRVAELEKAMLGVEHMVDIAHHPSDWAEYDDRLKAVIAAFHDALVASEGGEG